jgi:hypothetical protein
LVIAQCERYHNILICLLNNIFIFSVKRSNIKIATLV